MATPRIRTRTHTHAGRGVPRRLARQTTLWLGAFAGLFGYFLLRYLALKQPAMPPLSAIL